MSKEILIFLIIIHLSLYNSQAQTITICDKSNLQPIENVMISDNNQKIFALSNIFGKVDISEFKNTNTLIIRHPSYVLLKIKYDKTTPLGTIYLTETNIKISEVVISANKWEQNQLEIPSKITVINPKQIDLINSQTTADLLGNTGEVFIQKSQQGGGSPMIRGFATNRLLISVDGIRMNTAIFRSGNLQNIISLDPFATEKTEIFFGPGSVIYGSDAIGGVMSFNTLTPTLSLGDSIFVKGKANTRFSSSNNEITGHFDINLGWKKWALLSSLSYTKYGDLRMGKNGHDDYLRPEYVERINYIDTVVKNSDPLIQIPTGYSQTNLMQKIRFKPNKNLNFTYGFHYSTTTNYSRYDRLIRYKDSLPKSAEWYYGPQVWLMNNLNINYTSNSNLFDQLTIRLAHQHFEESRHDRNFNSNIKNHNTEFVNAFSTNIDFHKTLSNKHRLFYGIEAIYNDVNSQGTIEDISTGIISQGFARYPKSNWSSYAFYTTYNYKHSDKLTFSTGARYNQFLINAVFDTSYHFPYNSAYINNGAFTGSAGMVYQPIEQLWINSNLSTGFRSPNIDDMGKVFDSGEGIVIVPNPNLNAEYAYNIDLGITQLISGNFKYDITGYYTLLNNAMVRRNYQINGQDSVMYKGELSQVKAVQNAAQTIVYGIQIGVDITLPVGFGFDTRFNYQKGIEETDDGTKTPSRHAAPMFGITHITYSTQKFNVDLYAFYTAELSYENLSVEERDKSYLYAKDVQGNPYAPAWATLNIKAQYQFNKQLSITAGVDNITNTRYRPYSSGLTAAGRNYLLALKANF